MGRNKGTGQALDGSEQGSPGADCKIMAAPMNRERNAPMNGERNREKLNAQNGGKK